MLFGFFASSNLKSGKVEAQSLDVPCGGDVYMSQRNPNASSDIARRYSTLWKAGRDNFDNFQKVTSDPWIGYQQGTNQGVELNALGIMAKKNPQGNTNFFGIVPGKRPWMAEPGLKGQIIKLKSNGSLAGKLGIAEILQNEPQTPSSGYFAGDIRNDFLPDVGGRGPNSNSPDNRLYTYNLDDQIEDDNDKHTLFSLNVLQDGENFGTTSVAMSGVQNNDFDPAGTDHLNLQSLTNQQLSTDLSINDFAFNPKNGLLYGYDSTSKRILSINPVNGSVVDRTGISLKNFAAVNTSNPVQRVNAGVDDRLAHGASWFDGQGRFYTYRNSSPQGGGVFRFNINGNRSVDLNGIYFYDAQQTLTNDGAACPIIDFRKSVNPSVAIEGDDVTYRYIVENNAESTMTFDLIDNLKESGADSDGREFTGTPKYINPSDFSATPANSSTDSKILDIKNIKILPDREVEIQMKVKTRINNSENDRILKNIAKATNIRISGYEIDEIQDDARLTVKPLPSDQPYLRVYGNDVFAGAGFGESCTLSDEPKIESWAKDIDPSDNGLWVGAGTQYAASSRDEIDGFISSMLRHNEISDPKPHIGLSFGNTTNTGKISLGSSQFGGFSGITHCVPDYYNNVDLLSESDAQVKKFNNDHTINASDFSSSGKTVVLVNGDVTINSDINLNDNPTSVSNIPSLYVIAKGNINIHNSVDKLDGVYIAQPKDGNTKGEINTCSNSGGNAKSVCNNQLLINGAFIAKYVHFRRTNGSLDSLPPNAHIEPATSNNIAEVFNFGPSEYLAPLNSSLVKTGPYQSYDYIVSLPPIL